MAYTFAVSLTYLASLALALTVAQATPVKHSSPLGIDISDYQIDIDWTTVVDNGIQFVCIKATEGTSYIFCPPSTTSTQFGATNTGLIRGSYHFVHPDESLGGWSADGITLPGVLDIECLPGGDECYGLTASEMVSWIQDFSAAYRADFANNNPLWIADYASTLGSLPAR
ncbi:glycoside hydrolase family 25 protein [Tylopilus felleus]